MYLSEIKKRDIIFKACCDDIEKLVYEKDNDNVIKRCDIGFIFGGISMLPYRVNKGLKLYRSGLINKILLSGGIGSSNKDRKVPEAIKMEQYLVDNGVPKKDIIIEQESRNTIENVKNSIKLLSGTCKLSRTTFVLITSDFHIRRCFGLVSKTLDRSRNIYMSAVLDGKTDINSWKKSLYARRLILNEAVMLKQFLERDIINDIEIENLSFTKRKGLK